MVCNIIYNLFTKYADRIYLINNNIAQMWNFFWGLISEYEETQGHNLQVLTYCWAEFNCSGYPILISGNPYRAFCRDYDILRGHVVGTPLFVGIELNSLSDTICYLMEKELCQRFSNNQFDWWFALPDVLLLDTLDTKA